MSKRAELITIFIAALTLLVAIGQWLLPKTDGGEAVEDQTLAFSTSITYPSASLKVSGINSTINIKPGNSPYGGGKISSMDTTSTIYLPVGQTLNVKVSGMDVTLNIHRSVASFVSVSSSGMNTEVNEV